MFCAEWALVKEQGRETTVLPLLCKCWTCEECNPRRKHRLAQEAIAGNPNRFLTITSRYKQDGCPHAAARALVKAWRIIRTEYEKKHGKGSLQFLAVFEATKKGWPHLHIVVRSGWIDWHWLKKRMSYLLDSPSVDIRKIKSVQQLSHYLTKYLTKKPEAFKGTKRYWRSLRFLTPSSEEDDTAADDPVYYRVVRRPWMELACSLFLSGTLSEETEQEVRRFYRIPYTKGKWFHPKPSTLSGLTAGPPSPSRRR